MLLPSTAPIVWSTLCVASGALPSSVVVRNQEWYDTLIKPTWTPPPVVFPFVWTFLNVLVGWSACLSRHDISAMTSFAVNRALSLVWTPVFFGQRRIRRANRIAFVLYLTSWYMIATFRCSALLIPYSVWLALALALNVRIGQLNPSVQ